MLHDAIETEVVVDDEAAREFMLEATKLASTTELESIGQRLDLKRRRFERLLARDALGTLDPDGVAELLGGIFTLRRKAKRLLKANGLETVRAELEALLYGTGDVSERLDRFVANVGGLEKAMILSLATECLHFNEPGRYWLWTHWIWNPERRNGALALVVRDEVDLQGATDGAVYRKVGDAMAAVNAHGHAVGYARSGRGLFGTDVFLACVYSVYMYTVFRVKLSQEFNRILPELPELVERVLGVHRRSVPDGQ